MACPRPRGGLNYAITARAPALVSARRFPQTLSGTQYMSDAQHIQRRLIELDVEHRDLDAVIELLILDGHHDELQLRRLKKRKLQLKDHITLLKMQLVPDVPA
jgi:hypothetical protein